MVEIFGVLSKLTEKYGIAAERVNIVKLKIVDEFLKFLLKNKF